MTPDDDWDQQQQCWESEYAAWEAEQDDDFNFDMSEAFDEAQ
jgi:hypothetical protein